MNLSRRSVWLPNGEWFDFFSGDYYEGGIHARYGGLDDIPLYAKAGAIVPMGPKVGWGGIDNPETLHVVAFPGASNTFELYEDDGVTLDYREGAYAKTEFRQEMEDGRLTFGIGTTEGDRSHVPAERDYVLHFRGIAEPARVDVNADGYSPEVTYHEEPSTLVVSLNNVSATEAVQVVLESGGGPITARQDHTADTVEHLVWNFPIPAVAKADLIEEFEDGTLDWLRDYRRVLTTSQARALAETITGAGVDLVGHDGTDRIVIWNREGHTDVTFQYNSWDWGDVPHLMTGESDHDTVPEVLIFDASENDEAEVTLNYDDFVSVTCETSRTQK